MGLLANGVRRGPIKYELREGQLLANGSIREWQALPNQYLANYLVMTGTVFGAQLRRNVEEWSSPDSGPLVFDYLRTNFIAIGNEFGPHNRRWSRPRGAW
jgi:hypothetical protein